MKWTFIDKHKMRIEDKIYVMNVVYPYITMFIVLTVKTLIKCK